VIKHLYAFDGGDMVEFVATCPAGSLVLAPELALGGYQKVFLDDKFTEELRAALSGGKFLGLTYMHQEGGKIYNRFGLFSERGLEFTQDKSQLFWPNSEQEIFAAGDEEAIAIHEIDGARVGVIICFELRFARIWARLRGCDIILVPAMWAKRRIAQFEAMARALAVVNACYVIASDAHFAGVFDYEANSHYKMKFEPDEVAKFRRGLHLWGEND